MKKILFLGFIIACSFVMHAQKPAQKSAAPKQKPSSNTCYNEYYTTFRDRGANPVADGVNDVVVSIRKDGICTCVVGKITVKDGKPVNDLQLARDDGSFEKFSFTPHSAYTEGVAFDNGIFNGMSPTYFSSNDESINLFFIKALKDKKGSYKQAPPIK